MKFHEYRSVQASHPQDKARRLPWASYFATMWELHNQIHDSDADNSLNIAMAQMLVMENLWRVYRRPFYNVYPSVVKALSNTRLDFTLENLGFSLDYTAVCFPVGSEPVVASKRIASVLVQIGKLANNRPTMSMRLQGVDIRPGDAGRLIYSPSDKQISSWDLKDNREILALCVGIAMLARDGRFAEPILLASDQGKTFATTEERLAAIERAKNRGRNGLAIGKDIETSPHVRRPHFGIRWTEKGRSVPKLVPIAGSLVSRSKLLPVPTGYMDDIAERSRDRE